MAILTAGEVIPLSTKDINSWIFDDVRYDWDTPIVHDARKPTRNYTARQARATIRRLTAGFRAAGLRPGDCVCLHSFNDIQYTLVFLGVIAAGGCFTGANPSYTTFELAHHLKTAKVRFILTEPELLPRILPAADECNVPLDRIWVFDVLGQEVPSGFQSWDTLQEQGEVDWLCFNDLETSKTTCAARLFSSGTTGLPKAVELSHYNFVAQHTAVYEYKPHGLPIRKLFALPMSHAAMVPSAHTSVLRSGQTSYVLRRFDLSRFLASIEKYRINEVTIVPPIVVSMLASSLTSKHDLGSLRAVSCGAAPLNKTTQARFRALLPPTATVTQGFGMTELCCFGTKTYYPEDDDTGSVGRTIPNLEAKLLDDEGRPVTSFGQPGELCLRGPNVMMGYFENPSANAITFDDEGFLHTGDIAFCDQVTQRWFIVDRKKELLKVRGFQVAPAELEGVLLTNPDIADAGVIGVTPRSGSDKDDGTDAPFAYVVRRPGSSQLSEQQVKDWVADRLASYKRLTGGVQFLDEIPKSATGKILKKVLREAAEKRLNGQLQRSKL